jgi:acetylornithine deacetylase
VANAHTDHHLVTQQLKELIATPSVSSTDPSWDQGNLPLIERLADFAHAAGFTTEIQVVDASARKANLIATKGAGIGGLVLAGHSDTVPFDEGRWQTNPLEVYEQGQRFYGLGTSDMKGFFPLALAAAAQFDSSRLKAPLTFIATADEESTMSGAKALLKSQIHQAGAVIIGEPTNLRPIRMHKGMLMSRIVVHGHSGHSSNPALGNNAIDGMHRLITGLMALRLELQAEQNLAFEVPYTTLNLGHIHGGDSPNRICAHSELQFDLRIIPGLDTELITARIQALCTQENEISGLSVKWEPLMDPVPPFEENAESALVRLAESLTDSQAASALFATEAGFFKALGAQAIVMGPGSINLAHQPNEYLAFDQINPCIKLLGQTIQHYCA